NQADRTLISEISGVKKLDEQTVEITLEGVHPSAIWDLAEIPIAPEHYYCDGLKQGSFQKGQLAPIREKDNNPLGAGPYVFEKFENNVVFLNANENYLLGQPEIPQIKVVVSTDANMVDGIVRSEIDIAQVAATQEVLMKAEDEDLGIITTDFQGYGYIGINSENIADQNIRKGLLSLMNREPAVNTYFGGLAKVIERPMDSSCWAYPDNAEPFYSYDVNQALDYFKEAGYRQVTEKGKTVLEKDGAPLSIIAGVGGEGTMDHPAALVFTQMKTDLESLGAQLEIIDCDMSVLVEGLYQGSWDLWAASWELGMDPDMSSRYATGEESNFYRISNSRLDELLKQAVSTVEMKKRKELYQEAMEIVMDQGVELPLYQRQDIKVYNPGVIDPESLPEEMNSYYGYLEEIHKLRLVKP
ncbi:MAG: ABC transporter substrate-binding protein, partial [Eubacteriales bacterium]|nr:ABC transporter substrate-binding protein [Eubacteriales bacterium]